MTFAGAEDELAPIRELLNQRKPAEAEQRARESLSNLQSTSAAQSAEHAEILELLVVALRDQGKDLTEEAETLARRAVAIREAQSPVVPMDRAKSLVLLGGVLSNRRKLQESKAALQQAVEIYERAAPESTQMADALSHLAWTVLQLDELVQAESASSRSLEIRERLLGPDAFVLTWNLGQLASIARMRGEWERGSELFTRSILIREKELGPETVLVADQVIQLGWLLFEASDVSGARRCFKRGLRTYEATFGEGSARLAWPLNGLGAVETADFNLAEARAYHERALLIRQQAFGPDAADTGESHSNLAGTLLLVGDFEAAVEHAERALQIYRTQYGVTSLRVAEAATNLGLACFNRGFFERGIELFEEVVRIRTQIQGPDHALVAVAIGHLGMGLSRLGDFEQGRQLMQEALRKLQAAPQAQSSQLAVWHSNLAMDCYARGDWDEAVRLQSEAVRTLRSVVSSENIVLARSLKFLAASEIKTGRHADALQHAVEAETIARGAFLEVARDLPERLALRYSSWGISGMHEALLVLAHSPKPSAQAIERVWDLLIRRRALTIEEMAARRVRTREELPTEIQTLMAESAVTRRRLAELLLRVPSDDKTIPAEQVRRAREAKEAAEDRLRSALAEMQGVSSRKLSLVEPRQNVGLPSVRAAVPPGSAVLAFAEWQSGYGDRRQPHERGYLAFVLRRGRVPVMLDLGNAASIDSLIRRWRDEITFGMRRSGRTPRGAESAYREIGVALRARVWDSVQSEIGDASMVFIVPDGHLNLVNFATLPIDDGYLIESGPTFHYLAAERDLIRPDDPPPVGTGALICGDVQYDAPQSHPIRPVRHRGEATPCDDFTDLKFAPLEHSRLEVEDARRRLAATLSSEAIDTLTGDLATEESVTRAAVGRRVLHFATHAFFLPGSCNADSSLTWARTLESYGAQWSSAWESVAAENPLLLSGLALAASNRRESSRSSANDGILTAEEVCGLDLAGVEWAVLSACDTGVGVQIGREGVLGLRRAFELAGARSVIMSLWPVEDATARAWMDAAYEARFGRGQATALAVREAARAILTAQRERGDATHPSAWGAFVGAGDWR